MIWTEAATVVVLVLVVEQALAAADQAATRAVDQAVTVVLAPRAAPADQVPALAVGAVAVVEPQAAVPAAVMETVTAATTEITVLRATAVWIAA
jgi:hypothetical protein